MGLQELESKTTVYGFSSPIATSPLSWRRGKVELVGDGLRFVGDSDEMSAAELPREFFNHELDALFASERESKEFREAFKQNPPVALARYQMSALEPSAVDDLAAFVSRWGAPFSPIRFDKFCIPNHEFDLYKSGAIHYLKLEKMHLNAVNATDSMSEYMDFSAIGHFDYSSITISEAAATVKLLQSFVLLLQEAIREGETGRGKELQDKLGYWSRYVNAAACNSFQLKAPQFMSLDFPHGLTSAICNQIIDTIRDDVSPWRACKACGRIFKRKQGGSEKADSDSAYCCKKCADRQRQREYRASKRKAAQPKGSEHRGKAKGGVDNG